MILLGTGCPAFQHPAVFFLAGLYVMPYVVNEEKYADWYKFYAKPGLLRDPQLRSCMDTNVIECTLGISATILWRHVFIYIHAYGICTYKYTVPYAFC